MGTKTRFEEGAKGNSEMAYFKLAGFNCVNLFFSSQKLVGIIKQMWIQYHDELLISKLWDLSISSASPQLGEWLTDTDIHFCMKSQFSLCSYNYDK